MSKSLIINGEESTANSMKIAAIKRDNIRETLEKFHSQSSSLLQFAIQWKDLEEYYEAISDDIAKREEEIEVKSREIEWKQKYLNKKASDVEIKEEKVEESLRMVNDRREEVDEEYEAVSRMYSKVREKEKCCEDELEVVRCKSERLRKSKRDLKRKFEKKEMKLEARELMLDNIEEELELRREKLNSHERSLLERLQEVELREKRFEERVREFEKREKVLDELNSGVKKVDDGVKVKDQPVPVDFDNGDEDPSYADLKLNVTMDGRALQMFLNGRVDDHEVLRDEVIVGLGMSTDPAKLVLDALQGFYPEEVGSDECVGFDSVVVRKSCVLLLEQLMKMKPRIKARIKERAMKVALEWKGKLEVGEGDHFLEIVGFLQLVATYGLSFGFNKDELASLFGRCAMYDGAPELCCSLGLMEDVNDIIQNLIVRHQPFEALRLIYAFGLVNVFPPVPILKAHLIASFHLAEEVNNNGDPSVKLHIECIRMKLSALVSVLRCIQECGLDSKYPIQPLEQLVSELETQEKSLVSASQGRSMNENEELSATRCPCSTSVKETNTSMIAYNFLNESRVSYNGLNSMLTDSLSTQKQRNTGNKRPHLASVVVTNDFSRQQLISGQEWDFSRQAPFYHSLEQSWACYGRYQPSSYYCSV